MRKGGFGSGAMDSAFNKLMNRLDQMAAEAEKKGRKVGEAVGEGISEGIEDSFDDVSETVRKSEKELLKDLERAQKRFEKHFKKFPAAISKVISDFDLYDLRLVAQNMDNALDDIKESMSELRDIGAYVDDSWLKNMQKQIASMSLPGQTLTSDLDRMVGSLNKLNSINADPLNELVESIVHDKAVISSEVQDILKSLNLLNDAGVFTGKFITAGSKNNGVITNGQHAIIAREPDMYNEFETLGYGKGTDGYLDTLIAKEKEAAAQGVNLARILDVVRSKDMIYEIQELAPGQQVHAYDDSENALQNFEQACKRIVEATDAHIYKLMEDIKILNNLGFWVDFNPENIFYDAVKGFTLIDFELTKLGETAKSTEYLIEGLFECLTGFITKEDYIAPGVADADKWIAAMGTVYQRLSDVLKNNAGIDVTPITRHMGEYLGVVENTTIALERQGKVYKTVSNLKNNTFIKNEEMKRLAVEDTAKAAQKSSEIMVAGTNAEIVKSKELAQVRKEISDLYKQSRTKRDELKAVTGLQRYSADKITKMAEADSHVAHLYNEYLDINKQLGEKIAYRDQIKQEDEHAKAIEVTTQKAKEKQKALKELEATQRLIGQLVDKYGKESFNNIFGQTIADFGTLNASNAAGLYEALAAKESEYAAQMQKEEERRKIIGQEMAKFGAYLEENNTRIASAADGLNKYGLLLAEVSQGAITAESAIEKLNAQLAENNVLTGQSKTAGAYVSPLSDPALSGLLKGVDINSLTKDITLSKEGRAKLDGQLVSLVRTVQDITTTQGGFDETGKLWNTVDDHVNQIADTILQSGTYRVDSGVDKQRYAGFLNHFKTNLVRYTDEYKKEFGDEWRSIIGRFGGNNKILTKDASALTVNEQWGELKELFPDILTSNAENEKDQLKALLDAVQVARDAQKARKTTDVSLGEHDRDTINERALDVISQVYKNAEKIHRVEQQTTSENAEQLQLEQAITAEKQKQASTKNKALDETAKPEPTPIIDTDTERALEQLRQAESNKTPLIDLSGVYNTDDLTKELQGMAQTAWNEKGFVVDRVKVEGSTAAIKLYNKELEMSITQTYKMDAANEDAAASLKHLKDAYDYNVKALRGQEIDAVFEQRFAKAQIDNLVQPLKGAKYAGEAKLRGLAEGIVDSSSLETFKKEMKIATTEVGTFKKQLTSDLGTITKMSKHMNSASADIKLYRNEIEKLGATDGVSKLQSYLQSMGAATHDFFNTKDLEKQVDAYNRYTQAKNKFDKEVQLVRQTKVDNEALSKLDSDMANSIAALDTMESKLNKLGDVKGAAEAAEAISRMRIEAEKFNKAQTLSEKKSIYSNFKQSEGSFSTYFQQAQEAQRTQQEQQKQQEKAAKDYSSYMKSLYVDLMKQAAQMNTLHKMMNDLALKDGGTGLYSKSIQNVGQQYASASTGYQNILAEINSAVKVQPGENGLSKFFDVAREKSILTAAEIEKFNTTIMESGKISSDFASQINSKIQPTMEKLASLQQMVSSGSINNSDITKSIANISSALNSKLAKFEGSGSIFDAMDLTAFNNSISGQIAGWEKLAQKEAQYFASKREYTKGVTMDGGFNALSTDVKSTEKSLESVQAKLANASKEFSKGQAIITGFKQSADGISTLNFSVFDQATNSLRQFSMEQGTFSDKIRITENSINKSAHSVQAASQQLSKMSSLLKTIELSGFDTSPKTAHSSIQELHALMTKLSAAMQKGDSQMIDKLIRDSKLATSEVQKLYDVAMKLQGATGMTKAQNISNYVDGGNLTAYDQLTDAVHRHAAANDKATLSIGKFNEKQNTLNYTLTRGDGNVEHYTASINGLSKKIVTQQQGVTKLQSGWQHLSSVVSRSAKQMMFYFSGYSLITQVMHRVRQGVTYIKEIDTAMTELKKVTDETATSYARFVEKAAGTGAKIGATTSDFINASADFARIGYNMNEAGKMAEAAIVYKNVADGLDTVEAATESITSTMKAFGIESSDTMGIIDSFNEVGNNFAITSAGIGEALKRSASALAEGGNTMQESIGLITGANTVVQDPEVVGELLPSSIVICCK